MSSVLAICSRSVPLNRLTRIPASFNSLMIGFSRSPSLRISQTVWLVISPATTGTSVHCVGFVCSTLSMRSGLGSPSILYSIVGVFWLLISFNRSAMSVTSLGVMWRSSSRGCTVIPCAPAATHVSTAVSTSGTSPPREFLNVAILFIFTLKAVIFSP